MQVKTTGSGSPVILYQETQRFSQWWLWLIILACEGFILYALCMLLFFHREVGRNPAPAWVLLLFLVLSSVLVYLLWAARLDTKIDSQGVAYRWRPFQKKYRKIQWKDIEHAVIIRYFFAGYGWHWSIRFGEVHNTGGNRGLQLTFTNKRKLLLGTRQPDGIIAALKQLEETPRPSAIP